MIDYADERATVLQSRFRLSRKDRKCDECARTIKRGELYRYEVTKCDNNVESYHVCPQCLVVRHWLEKECGGWCYAGLAEDMTEHAREGGYKSTQQFSVCRLAVGINNGWWNGKMPKLAILSKDVVPQ